MLRTAVSLFCTLAVLAPTASFANDRHDRRDFNRTRTVERVRIINFDNRNRAFVRRDSREWERRDASRDRYWRDRRYDRRQYRQDYRRDRYDDRRIIIVPHFSF